MLKLVVKLLFFAILICGSMQMMFVEARRLERLYYEDSTYAWVNHMSVKPTIAILGSSTALYNLSPREICLKLGLKEGEVVNLGGIQRSSISMYHFWNTIAHNRDSIKIVLVSVDPWIGYQSYDWIQEFPTLYWIPGSGFTALDTVYPHSVLSGMVVTDVIKKSIRQLLKSSQVNIEAPGDYGSQVMSLHVKNFKKTARGYFGETSVYPISELYLSRMALLKHSVEEQGAKFVLLLPPKQSVWVTDYRSECREIDSDFINRMNDVLGPTRVIGSFSQFPSSADNTLFMDHDHLSAEGQRRFSDSIARQLPSVLISKPQLLKALYSY